MVGADAASEASIDLTVISDPVPSSAVILEPSDTISIEVSVNSGGATVFDYWFHVEWSPNLSVSVVPGSQWMPNFGMTEWWAHLSGNLAVDAYGLDLNGYDPGGKCVSQIFVDDVVATLVLHVIEPGSEAVVSAGFFLGDQITEYPSYQPIPDVKLDSVTIQTPEPASLLVLASGAGLLVLLGRLRQH